MFKVITVIVGFIVCTSTAVSAQPLQGSVHTNVKAKTNPLDLILWPGNFFDEKAATALLKDDSVGTRIWKKIPAWQAGTWESTQATTTKTINYVHGRSRAAIPQGIYTCKGRMSIGWQKDKNGDIWEQYQSGFWTEMEHDDYINHAFIKYRSPGTDEYPDLYSESISFDVDNFTKKITDVYQTKSWRRYVYIAPGLMKEEEVHTAYNERGIPFCSSWNTALNKRTITFAEFEIKLASRNELRRDFFSYLKNNGLADLIPVGENLTTSSEVR